MTLPRQVLWGLGGAEGTAIPRSHAASPNRRRDRSAARRGGQSIGGPQINDSDGGASDVRLSWLFWVWPRQPGRALPPWRGPLSHRRLPPSPSMRYCRHNSLVDNSHCISYAFPSKACCIRLAGCRIPSRSRRRSGARVSRHRARAAGGRGRDRVVGLRRAIRRVTTRARLRHRHKPQHRACETA